MINAILACDIKGGIGKDNKIPWDFIPSDIGNFRQMTMNEVVVMGSATWNSEEMNGPLPNRINVVVTSDPEKNKGADLYISGNLENEILGLKHKFPKYLIWIIGGGNVIEQCKDIIDYWYITRIHRSFDCDSYIPKIWESDQYEILHEEDIDKIKIPDTTNVTFGIWKKKNA